MAVDPQSIEELVAANRILADQGVLDGYGHVSVRQAGDAQRYLLARSRAPELVTTDDVLEFDLDSNPLEGGREQRLYLERFIHGEIYRARPDVGAVVHHHSPSVIPFAASTISLRALYHMSAFLGEGVPVFEIRQAGGMTDMLVRTPELARALARVVGTHGAALMRGHGAVVTGTSLPHAVGRAIYMELNARLQAQAIALGGDVTYLAGEEARQAEATIGSFERAWELWKRRVAAR
ncbi:MAG TPA: class II aldolase/adducin family protein [Methylomirabilota bacterium]|jgi:ribulose-5-phosphate 4-epimerase/fuculose-1-phosphate aldolase|nr:class II aldolase/adducin family protein [Methylomirabilota bacterium]